MMQIDLVEDTSEVNLDASNEEKQPTNPGTGEEQPEKVVEEIKEEAPKKEAKEKPEPVKIEPVSLDKLTKMVEFSFYTQVSVLALAILCLWGVANVTNPLNIFFSVAVFADGLANGPIYISSNILGLLYFILLAADIIIALVELLVRRRLKHEKGIVEPKLIYRNYVVTIGLSLLLFLSIITAITSPM